MHICRGEVTKGLPAVLIILIESHLYVVWGWGLGKGGTGIGFNAAAQRPSSYQELSYRAGGPYPGLQPLLHYREALQSLSWSQLRALLRMQKRPDTSWFPLPHQAPHSSFFSVFFPPPGSKWGCQPVWLQKIDSLLSLRASSRCPGGCREVPHLSGLYHTASRPHPHPALSQLSYPSVRSSGWKPQVTLQRGKAF